MENTNYTAQYSENKLSLTHLKSPDENKTFILAIITSSIGLILAVFLIFRSMGIFLLYFAIGLFLIYTIGRFFRAKLVSSAIQINEHNYPDIYAIYIKCKNRLSFKRSIEIYIVEDGSFNAALAKFFRSHFIILNSALVQALHEKKNLTQIEWVISRFIGSVAAKHNRLLIVQLLITSINSLYFLNLLIYPYYRETQYTGDQIGLASCQNLEQSIQILKKTLAGEARHKRRSTQTANWRDQYWIKPIQ